MGQVVSFNHVHHFRSMDDKALGNLLWFYSFQYYWEISEGQPPNENLFKDPIYLSVLAEMKRRAKLGNKNCLELMEQYA